MENLSKKNIVAFDDYATEVYRANGAGNLLKTFSKQDTTQNFPISLDYLITRLTAPPGKKSFLVFKHNKYTTVPTGNIAFFYVKYESSMIMSFNEQEYPVNYSLEQIQQLLPAEDFFRLNRQYLVNFRAIKEVEHYFARKLLVKLLVPAPEKLLVPKEKTGGFLQWLENR
jgi:DNA-binding LytR/AlgR family response regulator